MRSFAARSPEQELMDDPSVTAADFADCLADLAKVNSVTLARPPTLAFLAHALRDLPRGASFTLVDVGSGQGDMLRTVHRWATRRGLKPRLIGMDLNPWSEPAARAATPAAMGIEYRTGDVFEAAFAEPLDFVVSSLVTHHMSNDQVVTFLRWMEETTRRGWFVNDLHRHPLAFYGFVFLSRIAGWNRFVRHDGPVSVARAFRRSDWEALIAQAGLSNAGLSLKWVFPFRLCVGHIK
jgi:2-polyprenyl-3-methyl-5-hydroxy-6-metoxy-1,4-benzoquinol methylase